ncbi:MAG TPA: DUF1326 domain-containing protein [Verrucomicrobiae bacterium]|nr:DUF1326 domain-containing protein [Verrucomicrobiae bacterium]
MKLVMALMATVVLLAWTDRSLQAADLPCGDLLELHSCQLYIGGCIASSEATQEGKCLLRAWNFTGGVHQGVNLSGFQVAILEIGSQNLATRNARPTHAVIYLPKTATRAQSAALVDWLQTQLPELNLAHCPTRSVSMSLKKSGDEATFTAGDVAQVEVVPFKPCGLVSCGESLWYMPRSAVTAYTVGVTRQSVVREPLLALKWIDHGKNNVFLARFGEGGTARAAFTSPTLACATTDHALHE